MSSLSTVGPAFPAPFALIPLAGGLLLLRLART
jgi:hypothetical protein